MTKILKIIILFSLIPFSIKASVEPLNIVINEIAWMGTKANSSDEWIELYNNTNQDINLEDWALYEGETLIESLTNIIKANSYYLIERTDDSTIQNIAASQEPSSWGGYGLNNNGEHLKLLNQESIIIDEVNCSEGWFAGKGDSLHKTMERVNFQEIGSSLNNWQTNSSNERIALDSQNNPINGTPNAKNSIVIINQKEEITYSSNIIINEILPSPEGADSENEWIELKNQGNQKVSLFNWSVRDKKGTINTYVFPEETIIESQGFLVLIRPITNITLNNSEDGLELIQPDQNIIDSVDYINASIGESYNYINSEWTWSDQPSPNSLNLPKKEIKEENVEEKEDEKKEIININLPEETKENKIIDKNNFINVLLTAFSISILFSFLILKLKKKMKRKFDFP